MQMTDRPSLVALLLMDFRIPADSVWLSGWKPDLAQHRADCISRAQTYLLGPVGAAKDCVLFLI